MPQSRPTLIQGPTPESKATGNAGAQSKPKIKIRCQPNAKCQMLKCTNGKAKNAQRPNAKWEMLKTPNANTNTNTNTNIRTLTTTIIILIKTKTRHRSISLMYWRLSQQPFRPLARCNFRAKAVMRLSMTMITISDSYKRHQQQTQTKMSVHKMHNSDTTWRTPIVTIERCCAIGSSTDAFLLH